MYCVSRISAHNKTPTQQAASFSKFWLLFASVPDRPSAHSNHLHLPSADAAISLHSCSTRLLRSSSFSQLRTLPSLLRSTHFLKCIVKSTHPSGSLEAPTELFVLKMCTVLQAIVSRLTAIHHTFVELLQAAHLEQLRCKRSWRASSQQQ